MSVTDSLLADFLEFYRWRRLGEGSPITKVGRRVLYRRSSLQAWLHGREHHAHGDNCAAEQSSVRKRRSAVA